MWSAVELNIAIVCACLMVMKPLISRLFPQLFTESSNAENERSIYFPPFTTSYPTPTLSEATTVVPKLPVPPVLKRTRIQM
jgi:hypothetical protein